MRIGTILTILATLVAAAHLASAGSASDPQVQDETGDVSLQHLVTAGEIDAPADVPQETQTAGDIVKAWVHRETKNSFSISVELDEIPDETETSTPIVEVWTHFTVKEANYHTRAVLDAPDGASKPQARYTLYEESNAAGDVTGWTDVANDTVMFTIPKTDVRSPTEGDQLSAFYVTTHLPERGPVLDYAPGTEQFVVSPEADPTTLTLSPDVTYGDPYPFQSFDGPPQSDLSIELTESAITVDAGNERTVGLTLINKAPAHDTAYISLGNVPAGWTVTLDESSLSLAAGSSDLAEVTVAPTDDADGQELITLQVTSDLKADHLVTLSVTAEPAQDTSSSDDTGTTDAGDGGGTDDAGTDAGTGAGTDAAADGSSGGDASADADEPDEPEEKGAPSPAAWAVIATTGLAAWATARRRR